MCHQPCVLSLCLVPWQRRVSRALVVRGLFKDELLWKTVPVRVMEFISAQTAGSGILQVPILRSRDPIGLEQNVLRAIAQKIIQAPAHSCTAFRIRPSCIRCVLGLEGTAHIQYTYLHPCKGLNATDSSQRSSSLPSSHPQTVSCFEL